MQVWREEGRKEGGRVREGITGKGEELKELQGDGEKRMRPQRKGGRRGRRASCLTSLMLLSRIQQKRHEDGGTTEVGDAVDVHGLVEKVGSDPAGADVRAGQGGNGPAGGGREGGRV